MEVQAHQIQHQPQIPAMIIEVNGDVPGEKASLGGNKMCRGAACGFSDSATLSKDAKERSSSMKKLWVAIILCVIFMSVEVAGGIKANSLAILTDAAHLLLDVVAFAVSLFSLWASSWEATPRQSYGFFRIEILGALVSIQLIWLLAGILVYEAIDRLIHDGGEVQGYLMFVVSVFGLVVNVVMVSALGHDHTHGGHDHGHGGSKHGDHHNHDHAQSAEHGHGHGVSITTHHHHSEHSKHKAETEPLLNHSEDAESPHDNSDGTKRKQRNVNMQGTYLHALGDFLQSIGAMIGGAVIWYKPQWKIIDLVCTLVFSVIVLATTIKMLRGVLEVLMESTPREINATRLEKSLCEMNSVVAIHELHIWAITIGKVLLACHVTIMPDADADLVLDEVVGFIRREYNISHVTIQIERR